MSKQIKRQYKKTRIQFKKELFKKCKDNKALAMMIIQTYTAWHHRRHIAMIWAMLKNPEYSTFKKDYSETLMGKHLTGHDGIWRSFYFADKELYDNYSSKIPVVYAMGDAVGVAYRVLKG
ncbi:hypothetical protein HXA34_20140 [Salipaludibacillus agaradhaerens]|uniref:hypothetical protein n=1 Tax=Salipaludibacillus agaradhaerens TaxID=76935 RepID=UPI002151397E|nr:hypothetical protein [Salipaludibacillus agaradhaerens]MCR6108602.1 hypothetical protein [Salipaludibacillus agaradhaerens]MCR6120631.1 hypothetical protein [Salipaludibacillus agaradhaerens]